MKDFKQFLFERIEKTASTSSLSMLMNSEPFQKNRGMLLFIDSSYVIQKRIRFQFTENTFMFTVYGGADDYLLEGKEAEFHLPAEYDWFPSEKLVEFLAELEFLFGRDV